MKYTYSSRICLPGEKDALLSSNKRASVDCVGTACQRKYSSLEVGGIMNVVMSSFRSVAHFQWIRRRLG
jgi:hypothetical protein